MDNKLSIRIKKIRKDNGFTQQSFADMLNVHIKTVQGWEKNATLPDLENLLILCEKLGYDLDYITGRIDEPTHDIGYIKSLTGLSVEAIRILMKSKPINNAENIMSYGEIISKVLAHKKAPELLSNLERLINTDSFYTYYYRNSHIDSRESNPAINIGFDYLTDEQYLNMIQYRSSTLFSEIIDDLTNRKSELTIDEAKRIFQLSSDAEAEKALQVIQWAKEAREAKNPPAGGNKNGEF